jgi:hypothetical protein
MLQTLILIDALSSTNWDKERKKKREMVRGAFFPGPDTPCWLCCVGFAWLLGPIKG